MRISASSRAGGRIIPFNLRRLGELVPCRSGSSFWRRRGVCYTPFYLCLRFVRQFMGLLSAVHEYLSRRCRACRPVRGRVPICP